MGKPRKRRRLPAHMREKTTGLLLFSDLKDWRIRLAYFVVAILFAMFVIMVILPPLWIILSGFKDRAEFFATPPTLIPETFHPEEIVKTWNSLNFMRYYTNSFIVVVGSVVCALLFNGVLAFVIDQVRPIGYKAVRTAVLVSLMIPATTSLVPLFQNIVFIRQFLGQYGVTMPVFTPLWLAAGANAFYVTLYMAFFRTIPRAIMEAAQIDGCGFGRLFAYMIAPLSAPINMVVAIYAVNAAWSDFMFPYLVLFPNDKMFTVMVKLYVARDGGMMTLDQLMRCVAFAIVPPVVLFAIFQKYIIEGAALSGVKE